MSGPLPIDYLSWSTFCPIPGMRVTAEFSYGSKSIQNGGRYPRMRARSYASSRYGDPMDIVSIDIESGDFLVIRRNNPKRFEKGNTDHNDKIMLGHIHMPRFKQCLADFFENVTNGTCYEEGNEGGYVLTPHALNGEADIQMDDLYDGKTILFSPVVYIPNSEDTQDGADGTMVTEGEPGVRIYLNDMSNFVEASLSNFHAFNEFYQRFDLFTLSQSAAIVVMSQQGNMAASVVNRTTTPSPPRQGGVTIPRAASSLSRTGLGRAKTQVK